MLGLTLAMAATAIQPIDYTVSVAAPPGARPVVTIAMAFSGGTDGQTVIELPDAWAGSDSLWRSLGAPQVGGGQLVAAGKPTQWRITHRPGARITVRYAVADGQPGLPDAASYEKARPVIERNWFYIHGEGAFAIPQGREAAPARFRWGALPKQWRVAADVEHSAKPLTANAIGGSILIGGRRLAVTERRIGGATLRFAGVGSLPGGNDLLADRLERLVRTENAMLAAPAVPYLVTAIPLTGAETGALSYGGSGRTAGFALAMTANVTVDQLSRLIAHEYAHRWFGAALGRIADGAGPYWLTEGVNDWFAARAMVAAGLWMPAEWVAKLNEKLLGYGISSARNLTDAQITEQFWTNPDAMQVQYDRGQLIALLIDRRLNGGLIDILKTALTTHPDEDATAKFARLVDANVPGAIAAARTAVAAPLLPDALEPCGRIGTIAQPNYDRGFEIDDRRIVTAVRPGATAAGVRRGWRYVRRVSTAFGDSSVPLVAIFDTGAGARQLSWLPRGTETVTFQRLDGAAVASPACRALVAGSPPTP